MAEPLVRAPVARLAMGPSVRPVSCGTSARHLRRIHRASALRCRQPRNGGALRSRERPMEEPMLGLIAAAVLIVILAVVLGIVVHPLLFLLLVLLILLLFFR
jgi:hypothetical protein